MWFQVKTFLTSILLLIALCFGANAKQAGQETWIDIGATVTEVGPGVVAAIRRGEVLGKVNFSEPLAKTQASSVNYASPRGVAANKASVAGKGATNRTVTDFIDGVTVVDRRTGATFTGTVDLRPTLDRIDNGIPYPHRNDGSTFRNREGLLASQPDGYYTEFVHPTPDVNGPGPQRIIRGQGGELYYTPDHYGSLIPLNQ